MKHFFLTLSVAFVALFIGGKAMAYDCEVDGIYYYRISATELEVANKVFSDQNRTAYTGAVNIPSTVTYLGKTFNVVSIGEYAFRDCAQMTSITIPASVKEIKSYAFYNCSGVSAISIPATVTVIGEGAFEGCSSVTSMLIPQGVTVVEDETFYGCSALKTVILPNSLTAVGANAFTRCTALLSVYLTCPAPPTCELNAFDRVDRTWCTLYVPKSGKGYQEDSIWKDFFIEVYDGRIEDIPQNILTSQKQ